MKNNQNFPGMCPDNLPEELPFEIRTIQWMNEQRSEALWQPHRHNFFEVIWIIRGSGAIWIDLQRAEMEDNQVFCVRPGQMHQLHPDARTEGFVLSFTESFLNVDEYEFDLSRPTSFFQLFAGASGIPVKHETATDMKESIIQMVKEFENLYPFRAQVLRRYLKIFLIYLTRQFEDSIRATTPSRDKELVQQFMDLLERHFKDHRMVADYAGKLCVTPNYLNEMVKRNTGNTAGYHIRQRVALEAKRMGRYSDTCMKEIAWHLGFSDCGHFSKFFKTVTGTNFSDFKKGNLTRASLNV